MSDLIFEWDPKKNASNKRKHGVSFEEAKSVFTDQFARLLVVCHCIRMNDTIRVVSARKADKPEREVYERYRHA